MREELRVRTGFTAACSQQRRANFRSNHVEKAAFAEKHSKAAQRVIILDSSHQQGAAKFFFCLKVKRLSRLAHAKNFKVVGVDLVNPRQQALRLGEFCCTQNPNHRRQTIRAKYQPAGALALSGSQRFGDVFCKICIFNTVNDR